MLAIKLRPVGKKKQISYRIAVMEKKSKLKGKFLEDLGWYNAHTDKFQLKAERAKHWIAVGAQPTDSIHNLLVTAKVIDSPKIPLHKKSKQPPQEVKQEVLEKKSETIPETTPEIAEPVPSEVAPKEPITEEAQETQQTETV
ncbi:MAG: 30S ribosomal protein S16 [Candidatus Pacebacteria bacterium]|nr:30S ribosomal protein S16 [Candidatus Paceibacterota bacterium]